MAPRFPVFYWHPGANLHWLVLCDHASNRIPPELGDLGLSAAQLRDHIAWDVGAQDVARRLAKYLRAPMIEQGVSRLVIDANRAAGHRELIPPISDGIRVPGNQNLSEAERQRRWDRYFQPYHRRIDRHLQQLQAISLAPTLVSIHSFTPCLGSVTQPRPWPIAVLWDKDPVFASHMIRELGRDGGLVGDNQPYDGRALVGDTIDRHAASRRLRHATIELRQDQLGTPAARARWAGRLYRALMATAAQLRAPHAGA
ncbi:MAG TPA: N-formylglutamate amidohydrolase [Xanthomonadales bacterium]|nr:N-formylglutamate amidohydrolase [Xanthomonadales bacterium]